MSRETFFVTSVNPNDNCGGGGCACSESKVSDCLPPYAVFPATDMENNLSPHVVICLKCMNAACDQAKLEVLAAGEVNHIEGTCVDEDVELPVLGDSRLRELRSEGTAINFDAPPIPQV